ncbi:uncharacterized protein [Typha latifolia]|uniref:uncharacterized protein isoform X1 n=1 Tax=Typha latifolia TaxID=4733 RepID=UPI003C2B998E
MAIVTGDRYLEYLVRFVERNAGPLLDGALTLKLNPVGLHYVQSRLEALQELEALLAGAPVDYLRAYVSDLGDHRALEQLRRILRLLTSLKVISVLPAPARDPTPLWLLPFGRLKVLELRGCDLSTSGAKGLLELRHTLEKLICHNSTDALRHVFASRIVDIKDSPVWNRLSFVSCAFNGLVLMDESLQLLPVVETLDLSRNHFAKVDNLRKCMKLRNLDLGFNHLRSIALLGEVSCRIVKLVLRNNALTTLHGIENLRSLVGLDLSYNIISSFSELEILSSLSCLQSLWLEGNPICFARWYRAHVFSFFSSPEKLKLDDKGISTGEYWERHVIFASRQKQPAGYGFYFPAKDDPEDESNLNAKRKKNSRLACIEEEQRRYLCEEMGDQESISYDSDNLRKEENSISDGESKIVGLINKAENMKKEKSVLWLREFKDWMDQATEDALGNRHFVELKFDHNKGRYPAHKKDHMSFGESANYASDMAQTSEGGSSSNFLASDMSLRDACIDANGKALLEPSEVNVTDISIHKSGTETSMEQAKSRAPLREPKDRENMEQDPSNLLQNQFPLEMKDRLHHSSLTVDEGDAVNSKTNLATLNPIDEVMESRLPTIIPGSPPQYREDILYQRLYLEEEFLQLSAEPDSVGSSDSGTSCSDDASCDLDSSSSEDDYLSMQTSMTLGINGQSTAFPCKDNSFEQKHEKEVLRLRENNTTSDHSGKQDSDSDRYSSGNNNKQVMHDSSDDSVYQSDQMVQDVGGNVRRGGNRELKRRVIPLSENCTDVAPRFLKSNGIAEIGKNDTKGIYGQTNCHLNYFEYSSEELSSKNQDESILPINGATSPSVKTKTIFLDTEQHEYVKDFFHSKVADPQETETCEEVVCCECIFQHSSKFQESNFCSEVALLRSCKNKIYVLLIDVTPDGKRDICGVLESHRLEDVKKVMIGLGLQAMRVNMGDTNYVFLTKSIEKANDVLCLLKFCSSPPLSNGYSVESWEQVQVKFLEQHICGSLKMGIFFYSMLLFWNDDCEEGLWESRSLFVIEGSILVCIENLVQFGSCINDLGLSPYFSLDSRCLVSDILEMVTELRDDKCLTLILDCHTCGAGCFTREINMKNQRADAVAKIHTWKLKWFSEDTLLKFVALIKAIHSGLVASPLPVNCIS